MPAVASRSIWRPVHARDAREMVDRVPVRVAQRLEVADAAVIDGQRLRRRRIGDEALEPGPHAPVVRAELLGPEGRLLAGAEQHVDPLGLAALQPGELLVVEEELEDVRRLRGAGELRVEGLVRAVWPAAAGSRRRRASRPCAKTPW